MTEIAQFEPIRVDLACILRLINVYDDINKKTL